MNAEVLGLSADQKAMRRTGTGGSEIAAVVGLNPWKTALDVALSKLDGYEQEDNAAMERGRFLEDGVAQWYAHRLDARLIPCATMRHDTNPRALCTPDRLVLVDQSRDFELTTHRDLSIKVPGPQFGRDTWGEEGTDDVPLQCLLQLQWELGILDSLGYRLTEDHHLAAVLDGDLRVFVIKRDPELFAQLLAANDAFWRDYIDKGRLPEVDGSESATAYLSRKFKARGPLRKATLHEETLARALEEAEDAAESAETTLKAAQNRLKESIGEAEGIEGAFGKVTWRANKHGVRSFKSQWRKSE